MDLRRVMLSDDARHQEEPIRVLFRWFLSQWTDIERHLDDAELEELEAAFTGRGTPRWWWDYAAAERCFDELTRLKALAQGIAAADADYMAKATKAEKREERRKRRRRKWGD